MARRVAAVPDWTARNGHKKAQKGTKRTIAIIEPGGLPLFFLGSFCAFLCLFVAIPGSLVCSGFVALFLFSVKRFAVAGGIWYDVRLRDGVRFQGASYRG
jgi:hypothetical protein